MVLVTVWIADLWQRKLRIYCTFAELSPAAQQLRAYMYDGAFIPSHAQMIPP